MLAGLVVLPIGLIGATVTLWVTGRLLSFVTAPGRPFASISWLAVTLVWLAAAGGGLAVYRTLRDRATSAPDGERVESAGPVEVAEAAAPIDWKRLAGEGVLVGLTMFLLVGRSPSAWIDGWIGDVDTKYYGWMAWRLSRMGSPGLRLDGVVHPGGLELSLLDGLGPITLSGIGVRLAGRWLGYNLVVAGGLLTNYLAARHLARVVGADRVVAVACGLLYLASPVFVGPVGSFPSLLWACGPPLMLAEAIRAARGDIPVRLGHWAALLVGTYLCSIYHLVFGLLAGWWLG